MVDEGSGADRPHGALEISKRGVGSRPEGASTNQPRAERSAALGNQDNRFQALKGRDNGQDSAAWGEYCFALSGLRCGVAPSTQGGAVLCPGLTCSCPFRAIVVSSYRGFVLGGLVYFGEASPPAPSRCNPLDPVDFRPASCDDRGKLGGGPRRGGMIGASFSFSIERGESPVC